MAHTRPPGTDDGNAGEPDRKHNRTSNPAGDRAGTTGGRPQPLPVRERQQCTMLELKNITKSFGDAHVLNGISLTLDKGQIMSILGPSGGGKTTLLNIILGITDATGGQILFDGEDLTRVPMEKRDFNIVFQDYALFPNLNAYENITYGLRNNPGVSSEQEIREMISLLGLEEHLTKSIDELSGGQKQRVALARTLVMKPKLLLLDEPLSALDGVIKESIKAKIKQIVDQYHLTTIMVTHDPEEACTMSDRVLILNQGRIAQYDTPENIIEHPASNFVRDFILHQLEVKRNNIYSLFSEDHAAGNRREPALAGIGEE